MGSLSSRPKAVASVSTGSTATATTVNATNSATDSPINTAAATDAVITAKNRVNSILQRSRGVMGNVITSFRGVLSSRRTPQTPSRKSLLGE